MSPAVKERVPSSTGFPRVSGDEPYADLIGMLLDAFSPRERG